MTYGDRCLIGLVSKGERKGVREEHYGYPNGGLGDAIIKFILARTDLELVEMIHKVENLQWVKPSQVENLDEAAMRHLHFPMTPRGYWFQDPTYKHACSRIDDDSILWTYDLTMRVYLTRYKQDHPDSPLIRTDKEIMTRYIPCIYPWLPPTFLVKWVPELDEVIDVYRQTSLLDRIWDGRQTLVIDETELEGGMTYSYIYWIDFDKRVLEVEGIVPGRICVPFAELRVDCLVETVMQKALRRDTAELDSAD